jgi:metal-responsive CopG/Arc/MetJ family transcriptional regulator
MEKGERKVKVTISVSSDLLRRLDRRRKGRLSRSAAIEAAIDESDRAARRKELEEEIRAYYSVPPTAEETAMSKALGRLAAQAWAQSDAKDDDFNDWDVRARKRK